MACVSGHLVVRPRDLCVKAVTLSQKPSLPSLLAPTLTVSSPGSKTTTEPIPVALGLSISQKAALSKGPRTLVEKGHILSFTFVEQSEKGGRALVGRTEAQEGACVERWQGSRVLSQLLRAYCGPMSIQGPVWLHLLRSRTFSPRIFLLWESLLNSRTGLPQCGCIASP